MKRLPITMMLVAALAVSHVGCGTTPNGQPLTSQQQATLAFLAVDSAFSVAEAVFIVMEKEGVSHMPAARAAWTIVKTAIESYLTVLQTFGILEVPATSVASMNSMQERAIAMGVETPGAKWFDEDKTVYSALQEIRGLETVAQR